MARTTEFVLGLIGGIFGFFAALIGLAIGGIGGAFGASGASTVVTLGRVAILFSIVGIVGSVLVRGKPKWGGALMLVSGIGGVICISYLYISPLVLLLIAGLMGIFGKTEKGEDEKKRKKER